MQWSLPLLNLVILGHNPELLLPLKWTAQRNTEAKGPVPLLTKRGGFGPKSKFSLVAETVFFLVMAIEGMLGKMTKDLENGNFGDHFSEEIVLTKDQENLTSQMDRLSDLNSKCLDLANNGVL